MTEGEGEIEIAGAGESIESLRRRVRDEKARQEETKPISAETVPVSGETEAISAWLKRKGDPELNPRLQKIVDRANQRTEALWTPDSLVELYEKVERLLDKEVPEAEVGMILSRIANYAERRFPPEEPEVERIKDPETVEGWIENILSETFEAMKKGTKEKRGLSAEKMFSEYTAITRALERIPAGMGKSHDDLGRYLAKEYPEGVYLKEKLELVFEALRRVHNRKLEVLAADGGLAKLGAVKGESPLKPELEIEITNIRPVDWYVLAHFDDLFPEVKGNKELALPVDKVIQIWKRIKSQPIRKVKGKYKQQALKGCPCSLEEAIRSERNMANLRAKIVELIGSGRAEQVAFDILTDTLSFPCWDRMRWKEKGKLEDRDLMWFDWKRVLRYRAYRPSGPHDNVGCFWAYEEQDEKISSNAIPNRRERKKRERHLRRNKERAIFIYKQTGEVPDGTILGDFFSSTSIEDKGEQKRLSDYKSLKDVPWLDPERFMFEEETYAGYFGYPIPIAQGIVEMVKKQDWDPEDLKSIKFWEGFIDLTVRLPHFSPSFNTKSRREQYELIMRFRRAAIRGIFWTGSYLAKIEPGWKGRGSFSKEDVYGSLGEEGILDKIRASGVLDKKHYSRLRNEIMNFKFHARGRGGPLDILLRGRRAQ